MENKGVWKSLLLQQSCLEISYYSNPLCPSSSYALPKFHHRSATSPSLPTSRPDLVPDHHCIQRLPPDHRPPWLATTALLVPCWLRHRCAHMGWPRGATGKQMRSSFFSCSGARFLLLDRGGDIRRRRGEWRRSGEEGRGNQGNHPAIMDVPRGLPHGTRNTQCSSNFDFYPSSTPR